MCTVLQCVAATKSLLRRVAHGQLYATLRMKATGQVLEKGADIVFRKEASAQHRDIYTVNATAFCTNWRACLGEVKQKDRSLFTSPLRTKDIPHGAYEQSREKFSMLSNLEEAFMF